MFCGRSYKPGIGCGGLRKVTNQGRFRQLLASDPIQHLHHLVMTVLARPRMHVQIKSADRSAIVDYIPGLNGRRPGRNTTFLAEGDVKQGCAVSRMPWRTLS
jgi:hypothetical protein